MFMPFVARAGAAAREQRNVAAIRENSILFIISLTPILVPVRKLGETRGLV
jgi:hypothetical protein